MDLSALPGGDLIERGLADLASGRETTESLLVSIGAPRLRTGGIVLPRPPIADPEHKLRAEVVTPEGPVFDGEVIQVSTRTVVGEIGVLANHVPFVARLVPADLRLHLSSTEVRHWAQAEGWLEVFANRALVLVGEAIPPDRLDRSEQEQRLADAEQRLADAEEGTAAHRQATPRRLSIPSK